MLEKVLAVIVLAIVFAPSGKSPALSEAKFSHLENGNAYKGMANTRHRPWLNYQALYKQFMPPQDNDSECLVSRKPAAKTSQWPEQQSYSMALSLLCLPAAALWLDYLGAGPLRRLLSSHSLHPPSSSLTLSSKC